MTDWVLLCSMLFYRDLRTGMPAMKLDEIQFLVMVAVSAPDPLQVMFD